MSKKESELQQRRTSGLLIAAILLLVLFGILTVLVVYGKTQGFDEQLCRTIYGMRKDGLTTFMEAITYLGNWQAIVIVCILSVASLLTGSAPVPQTAAAGAGSSEMEVESAPEHTTAGESQKDSANASDLARKFKLWIAGGHISFWIILMALLTTFLKAATKMAVARPRPDISYHLISQGGFSFPSGHSITAIAVYGMVCYWLYRSSRKVNWQVIVVGLLPFLIAFSRVYLGVHYPSDVIAGLTAGGAILCWGLGMIRLMRERKAQMRSMSTEHDRIE